MSKVYVVTQGEYSANRIIGVFSDEEQAQKYKDYNEAGYYREVCYVEEFELDPDISKEVVELQDYYKVHCFIYNSEATTYIDDYDVRLTKEQAKADIFWCNTWLRDNYLFISKKVAKDKEHAEKIARDKYYELLAQNLNLV